MNLFQIVFFAQLCCYHRHSFFIFYVCRFSFTFIIRTSRTSSPSFGVHFHRNFLDPFSHSTSSLHFMISRSYLDPLFNPLFEQSPLSVDLQTRDLQPPINPTDLSISFHSQISPTFLAKQFINPNSLAALNQHLRSSFLPFVSVVNALFHSIFSHVARTLFRFGQSAETNYLEGNEYQSNFNLICLCTGFLFSVVGCKLVFTFRETS